MQIIYIAGRVTGLPIDEVRLKFSEAEMEVRKMGFLTLNPVEEILQFNEFDEEGLNGWQQEMDFLVPFLSRCHGIYMLRDWRNSKGARIEYENAIREGKILMFQPEIITTDRLIRATEEATGMPWEDIKAKCRKRDLVTVRKVFSYLAVTHNSGTLVQIGGLLGQDYTTIIHSKNSVEDMIETSDEITLYYLNAIKRRLAV